MNLLCAKRMPAQWTRIQSNNNLIHSIDQPHHFKPTNLDPTSRQPQCLGCSYATNDYKTRETTPIGDHRNPASFCTAAILAGHVEL